MTFKEGLYSNIEMLASNRILTKLEYTTLKMWADSALAEAENKNSFVMENLISFTKNCATGYDHEEDYHRNEMAEGHCRQCMAEAVLKLVEDKSA